MKTALFKNPIACAVLVWCISGTLLTEVYGQAILEADGPGSTYELINQILAPGGNAVEHPECVGGHPEFGRHITEVWDSVLNQFVFEFYIHVGPDNDRCLYFDRQRVEIKTYDASPDTLKGVVGETITYRWKFRLPEGFQPSTNFTHIHQIKAVGGDDGDPIFTLTPRKSSPNKLELIHNNATKVRTVELASFIGVWVECTETVTVGAAGAYALTIKRVSDGATLLSYSNPNIMTIRPDNNFIRPKWGIYRSLLSAADLRDETVRFSGFSIKEGLEGSTSVERAEALPLNYDLSSFPNPFNPSTTIRYQVPTLRERGAEDGRRSTFVRLQICDALGQHVATLVSAQKPAGVYEVVWRASEYPSGVYWIWLQTPDHQSSRKIVLVK